MIKQFLLALVLISSSIFAHPGHENPRIISARQAEMGELVAFPELVDYVKEVGYKLAKVSDYPNLPYEFFVLNSSIPNAWAFPGGKIGITRGFLLKVRNEAELASILAHEIGHQTAYERDRLKRMESQGFTPQIKHTTRTLATLVHRTSMRASEYEADRFGIQYLARAGYDVQAAIELQKHFLLHDEGVHASSPVDHLFETHPSPQSRIDYNLKTALSLKGGTFKGEDIFAQMVEPLKNAEEAYKLFDEGDQAFHKGDLTTAHAKATLALSKFDKEPLFYGLLGKAKEEWGDYEGSLAYFEQALKLNEDYFEFHLHRGIALKKLGYQKIAEEELELSQLYYPTALADYHLGEIAIDNRALEKATEHLLRASSSRSLIGYQARTTLTQLDHILSYLE